MHARKMSKHDDFDAIGNIYARSWQTAYRGIVPQDYLDGLTGSRWSSRLESSPYDAYVLIDGEKYIGASSICAARDSAMAGWGEIISFYLLPEYFGKGYAAHLLERVVMALADSGYENIYLWVLAENIRAQKFYIKQGFQHNGDAETITIGGKDLTEIRFVRRLQPRES